ncbi:hypothetical protein HDU98_001719, partial [Podochytrium sp. JEL0797]
MLGPETEVRRSSRRVAPPAPAPALPLPAKRKRRVSEKPVEAEETVMAWSSDEDEAELIDWERKGEVANVKMSEYEIERLRRLEENKKQLMALGIFKEEEKAPKEKPPRTRKQPVAKPVSNEPRRQSGRLSGKPEEFKGLKFFDDRDVQNDDTIINLGGKSDGSDDENGHEVELEFDENGKPIVILPMSSLGKKTNTVDAKHRKYERGGRIYDSVNGTSCHQCRQKTLDPKVKCTNIIIYRDRDGTEVKAPCTLMMDNLCLEGRYGESVDVEREKGNWVCPKCRGICNCSFCMAKRGKLPTGQLKYTALEQGYKCVSDMLSATGKLGIKKKVVAPTTEDASAAVAAVAPAAEGSTTAAAATAEDSSTVVTPAVEDAAAPAVAAEGQQIVEKEMAPSDVDMIGEKEKEKKKSEIYIQKPHKIDMLPLPSFKSLGMKKSGSTGGLLSRGGKAEFNKNFDIEKKVRFSNRFFQIALACASYYFLGQMAPALEKSHPGLYQTISFNWIVAIASPIAAGLLVGQYFAPFIVTNWTSSKILMLELLIDTSAMVLWIGCFGSEIHLMGSDCPPATSYGCDMFNWSLAWNILSFFSWATAVGLDIHSLGVGWGYINYGDPIADM